MIFIYKYFGIFLIPLIKLNIKLRIFRGKELKDRFHERYGISQLNKPNKEIIWIHAASVGEFKSADLIINNHYKEYAILVTTTTVSAANYAMKHYGNKIIHQFAPLDIIFWVEKFITFWKPKLVIWIESDIWPITMKTLKKSKINAILVNVRMSPQSFNKWKKFKFIYREITDCFSEIFAQSQIDRDRIKYLTKREVKFIGNLKLSTINEQTDPKEFNHITIKNSPAIMFASTHYNEEMKFLPIIKSLISEIIGIKIFIAPRHPERSNKILRNYIENNLSAKVANETDNTEKDIVIINSFGNLKKYFIKSDIVVLGGSFIKKGGHNPIEPAIYNCAILTGSSIYNWQNIYDEMNEKGACEITKNIDELEKKIKLLFFDKKMMLNMKNSSNLIAQKNFFDREKLFKSINTQLESSIC